MSLKIALDCRYINKNFPGIGRYTYNLAAALARLETAVPFRLYLICNPPDPTERYPLEGLAREYPARVEIIKCRARPISGREQWELPKIAMRYKFHLWHAPYYIYPYLVRLFCPVVLTSHDLIGKRLPQTLPSRKARAIYEITNRLAFFTAKHIIAVSLYSAQDIMALYRVKPGRVSTVLSGVEEKFGIVANLPQVRQKLALPARYLLYVGINKPHKNLARLLEAFAQRNPPDSLMLLLAGREDPRYSPELRQKVAELKLESRVRFWGEVTEEDLVALYNCATLYVQPSLYEGFGLPLLEAQACGLPAIIAGNTSLPEVGGAHVPTFDPYNVGEIAQRLEEMLGNGAERERQRELGLVNAASLSWERVAQQTFELYLAVINKQGAMS
jgi:alpha-1,3-rhamnosyl/mannosyltransferase